MDYDYSKASLDALWRDLNANEELFGEIVYFAAVELIRRGKEEEMIKRGVRKEWIEEVKAND